ncbi:MAG: helix-turn-helix domain-containing protein [Pseudonocardia sp.]|nr:helix-turn-helix domain-containing protein [Pseudonocardia sp.]
MAETVAAAPPDGSDVGEVIRWYRQREGLTQQDAATLLNTTQSRLSKLEKGSQALRDIVELRHVASKLGIPPERLGVLPDRSGDATPRAEAVSLDPGPVRDSQERWRGVRAELNGHRALLGDLASDLYPAEQRIAGTSVLTAEGWMPDEPVDLAAVEVQWLPESPPSDITGKALEAAGSRAALPSGKPYDRYSRALRDLARPKLFDNRHLCRPRGAPPARGSRHGRRVDGHLTLRA